MQGLELVGAKRVGPLGKANAAGQGEEEQSKVIERWTADIWKHLATIVSNEPLSMETLTSMKEKTMEDFKKVEPKPDAKPGFKVKHSNEPQHPLTFPALGLLV